MQEGSIFLFHARIGRCRSTVLRVALGRALIYEGNETVLGTNPNRTHDQPKPYLETAETVLDLYSDKGMFPFLLRGAHKKNSLKIDAFPVSNRTRNRTRTAAERRESLVHPPREKSRWKSQLQSPCHCCVRCALSPGAFAHPGRFGGDIGRNFAKCPWKPLGLSA